MFDFKIRELDEHGCHSMVASTGSDREAAAYVVCITRTSMGLAVGCSVYAEGPASYGVRRTLSYYDGSGRQHVDDYT